MKILSEQKSKALAEENGWSLEFANGYIKGEFSRRASDKLSSYFMVGLDDYSLGFRAGYFGRQTPPSTRLEAHVSMERRAENARAAAAPAGSAATVFKQGFAY